MSKQSHSIDVSERGAAEVDSPLLPFVFGAIIGGVAGAVLGAVVTRYSGPAGAPLAAAFDRVTGEKSTTNKPRFELLLQ